MKYWIVRLSHPLRGLKYAFTRDFAVRFEIIVFGIIGIPETRRLNLRKAVFSI